LFRIPHAYQDSPEQERCELILWIEADWHREYWMRGESGAMRLLNGPDTILEVPVTDPDCRVAGSQDLARRRASRGHAPPRMTIWRGRSGREVRPGTLDSV